MQPSNESEFAWALKSRFPRPARWLLAALMLIPVSALAADRGRPWTRHVIDDSSRGADGVRLDDVNGDGLSDIVTGWEEGGITRLYVHPGHSKVRERWPAVTVGKTPSVEDAVLVDLDADGHLDVVSSCEGRTRTVFVHWAPNDPNRLLDPKAWKTEPLDASIGRMAWMFVLPMQVDARRGIDLIAAAKGKDARIGWFESPDDPRELDRWTWHPLSPAGWIMSLRAVDLDTDGDLDVLTSDRKGPMRGIRWLENPGAKSLPHQPWPNHFLAGRTSEVMFLTTGDLNADRADEIVCAIKDGGLLLLSGHANADKRYQESIVSMPDNTGSGKGLAIGHIDADGQADLVVSCERANGERSGVFWLAYKQSLTDPDWTAHEISGPAGIKFDRLELLDLDGDTDLDVLACEESHPVAGRRRGLGVFWYENPR